MKHLNAVLIFLSIVPAIFAVIAVGVSVGGGLFIDATSYYVTTKNITDYNDWSSYVGEIMDRELACLNSGLLIFPDSVDGLDVEMYYANISGRYGDSSPSCTWQRLLVVDHEADTYALEKERIASLTLTAYGQTNSVLHNERSFPLEAYVALYDGFGDREYALCDDESGRIIYVFNENGYLDDIPVDFDIKATGPQLSIVPSSMVNDGNGGYSLYYFWENQKISHVW